MPTMARSTKSLTILGASVLLGACSGESTAPAAATVSPTPSATSTFTPSAASMALIGVSDGTYKFTVDPTRYAVLLLGADALTLPANSICAIGSSDYGASYWNTPCETERSPVIITAVVRNAKSDHPSINFYPAMRFNPKKSVELAMYVPQAKDNPTATLVMQYCNDAKVCVDESFTDPTLVTYVDRKTSVVHRRVKHFSGYVINGLVDNLGALLF